MPVLYDVPLPITPMMTRLLYIALALTLIVAHAVAEPGAGTLYDQSPFAPAIEEMRRALVDPDSTERLNAVGIVNHARDALVLRVHLIQNARHTIDIQTFIWENDASGNRIMYELIQAARRGVRVRFLTDHLFSDRDPQRLAALCTTDANLEIRYFRPLGNRLDPSRLRSFYASLVHFKATNKRMHNKVMIFDDAIAITGGRNIDDHYFNNSLSYNFKDRDVLVLGAVLPDMIRSFEAFWDFKHSVPVDTLKDVARVIERQNLTRQEFHEMRNTEGSFPLLNGDASDNEDIRRKFVDTLYRPRHVEFIWDLPGKNTASGMFSMWGGGPVADRLQRTIADAQHDVVIQSPYLILERRTRRLFRKLKRERPNLDVRISTNSFSSTDNVLAYSYNYKMRPLYIKKLNFAIYEYKPRPADLAFHIPNFGELEERAERERPNARRGPFMSMHGKSMVVDDRISYIGSFNMDPRSTNLNTEEGLLIEDEQFAQMLKDDILRDMAPENSWVIARRKLPFPELNSIIEDISTMFPIDPWPLKNTTSFELIPGKTPLHPRHADFYDHYRDSGPFPGSNGLSTKEIVTQLYKIIGKPAIPIL
ncbi:MAG: phospholipase D family protein [Candidatus Hydrogenedentes bacterium]|nr:phospholipase D family protein [Candidatus Hydrogenedentota bacterium]